MSMNYEMLHAKYGEDPERSAPSPETAAEKNEQETAPEPVPTNEKLEANTASGTEQEKGCAEVTSEEKRFPASDESAQMRELLDDGMAELGQRMMQLEQQMAALCSGVEQIRQGAARDAAPSAIAEKLEELRQANVDILRDSKNFQATVREQMQRELDQYHKMHAETANAPVLTDIANLYIMSSKAISYLADEKERKNISEIVLEGLIDILEEQGVTVSCTPVGEKRSIRTCKTRKTVPTGDIALQGTVAESFSPSFTLGNQVLIKESVDTYVYDAALAVPSEADESTASEVTGDEEKQELTPDVPEIPPVTEVPAAEEATAEPEASDAPPKETAADAVQPAAIGTDEKQE